MCAKNRRCWYFVFRFAFPESSSYLSTSIALAIERILPQDGEKKPSSFPIALVIAPHSFPIFVRLNAMSKAVVLPQKLAPGQVAVFHISSSIVPFSRRPIHWSSSGIPGDFRERGY